jgi:chemotaxis protein MotB
LIESRIAQLKATYNALISDLKKQIENDQVTIKEFEEKISVSFVDSILFEFGKATITDEGMKVLDKIGKTLRNAEARQIRVVGHTDNVSIMPQYRYKFPSNWELSAARAAAVVRYLQEQIGIDPKSLEVVGHSFYHPVADNETPTGRAQNRRVIIVIAPRI